jgi:hypothetical protein
VDLSKKPQSPDYNLRRKLKLMWERGAERGVPFMIDNFD